MQVLVPDYEINYQDGSRAFAAYRITCSEDGVNWECSRRWNDLKVAFTEVQREHAATLNEKRDSIPKFEAHSWRLGSSNFDGAFLQARCKSMQELLQALVVELGVSVRKETGPEVLRQFLKEGGQPGLAPTPMRHTISGYPLSSPMEDAAAPSPLCVLPGPLCSAFRFPQTPASWQAKPRNERISGGRRHGKRAKQPAKQPATGSARVLAL